MTSFRLRTCLLRIAFVFSLFGVFSVPREARAQCGPDAGSALTALAAQLFGEDQAGGNGCGDGNGDGGLSAADVVAMLQSALTLPSPTPAPSPTPTPRSGPLIAMFGLAAADGSLIASAGSAPDGSPLFQRPVGSGFQVVIEALAGSDGAAVGTVVFNWKAGDPTARPDLQIETSRALGNGGAGVCDGGGVPGFDPPDFGVTQMVANALNDLGCGFDATTNSAHACTIDGFGSPAFVSSGPHVVQFCQVINADKAFPPGDTMLTAQLRNTAGNLGPTSHIFVRIGSQPVPTATSTPSRTATNSFTPTRTATATATATATPTVSPSRTATSPRPSATPTPTTATPAAPTATPSATPTTSPSATPTGTLPRTATPTPTLTPSQTATATPSITGTRPPDATATRTNSPTATPTVAATPSPTATAGSASPTRSATSTATATMTSSATNPSRTRTPTSTASPTASVTSSRTPTQTPTPSSSPTASMTRTPTATPQPSSTATWSPTLTPTASFTATRTPTASPTRTNTVTPTLTLTRTPTRTPTVTATVTRTPTVTPTPTVTFTPTVTPTSTETPTPTPPPNPLITYFGVALADDTVLSPIGYADDGSLIYQRPVATNTSVAYGFRLVVEGRPDPSLQCGASSCMGDSTLAWSTADPTALPDLQIEASNNLGNGSPAVCDDSGPTAGGVPAVNPFDFSLNYAPAINDFSCRFKNGLNAYFGITNSIEACTKVLPSGVYQFFAAGSKIQFCGQISQSVSFPLGDTVVAARIRDADGNPSQVSTIVIRVELP